MKRHGYKVKVRKTKFGYGYEVYWDGRKFPICSGNEHHKDAAKNWADRFIDEHLGHRALELLAHMKGDHVFNASEIAEREAILKARR